MTIPGMKSFVAQGNWLGTAPRGYDHYGPRVSDPKRISHVQRIVINAEGRILKKAWQLKSKGLLDYQILAFLRENGVKMNRKSLSQMWRRPFYCGVLVHKMLDGKVVQGNHKPLVSHEDFIKINKDLEIAKEGRRRGNNNNTDDESLPLRNFVRSQSCGTIYCGYVVKGKWLFYYKNNRPGSKENIRAEKLHDCFVELLRRFEIQVSKDYLENMNAAILDKVEELLLVDTDGQEAIQRRVETLGEQLKKLKKKYILEESIDEDDYFLFKKELEKEQADLLKKIRVQKFDSSNLVSIIEKASILATNISHAWLNGTYSNQKSLQEMLFPEGIVFDFKNKQARTTRVNTIFNLTNSLSMFYEANKKGTNINFDVCPSVVAGTGLEPVTFGL
ncbi:MAG: recombinase family protein [Cyclobacteriaceae bacterium]